ncbi:MAG TPA: hypothetical protein PKA38_04305 [Candidatus Levybacteria bacterium]|nr:hypothetical protein [Candidatus Levybacteria bacterium]
MPEDYDNLHLRPNPFENPPPKHAPLVHLLKDTVYDFFDELPEGIKKEVNVIEKQDSKKRGMQEKVFYIDFDKYSGDKNYKLAAQNPDAPFSLFHPNTLLRVGFAIQEKQSAFVLRIHGSVNSSEDFSEVDSSKTVGQRGNEITTLIIKTENKPLSELREKLSSTLGDTVPYLAAAR